MDLIRRLALPYGGKRGFARHVLATVQTLMPGWWVLRRVDWGRIERFVFVCKGNICRSPYSEARAVGLGLRAVSAGLAATPGLPANEAARQHAVWRRLSLDAHRTTLFRDLEIRRSDLLVCMEPPQAVALLSAAQAASAQLTLLGLWSRPRRPWLGDPYGAQDAYWRICFDLIDSAVERMAYLSRRAHDGH